VAGAKAAGMQAVWRRVRGMPQLVEADAVIDELDDLLPLLGVERNGHSR
jgi:FMN phosphatase YigB (HAD superfamily)